jgi:hypothetical protein
VVDRNGANKIPQSDLTLSSDSASSSSFTIGSYRLFQKLGEEGMGEVWLAEQTAPIHRTVAVKLIKAGMDTLQSGEVGDSLGNSHRVRRHEAGLP